MTLKTEDFEMTVKQYADRDIIKLDEIGGYYIRHVLAMTAEELHSKSDIAAELAFRDAKIDKLRHQVKEAEKRRTDLVPGIMHCAKCNFELIRSNLYVKSGTVGPGGNETEPCPNGCGPLWPITWEQYAKDAIKRCNKLFDELTTFQQKLKEAREQLAAREARIEGIIRNLKMGLPVEFMESDRFSALRAHDAELEAKVLEEAQDYVSVHARSAANAGQRTIADRLAHISQEFGRMAQERRNRAGP